MAIYGDEAVYSATHQDKFICLTLQSPLLHKAKCTSVVFSPGFIGSDFVSLVAKAHSYLFSPVGS